MAAAVTPEELEIVEKVAHRIGSKWRAVEIDDLTSHLYLWVFENLETLDRWRKDGEVSGRLYVALRNEASKYAAKEQAIRNGQPLNANNFYTTALLDRTLPYLFEDTPQTTVKVNPRNGAPAQSVGTEFDTALAILADIRGGFYGLRKDDREILEYRYRDGLTFEEIGEIYAVSNVTASNRVNRALERLSHRLAGDSITKW